MMRLLGPACALLSALSCAPGAVDYSALTNAAEARQRRAGADPSTSASVGALLTQPLTAETTARISILNNPGLRAAVEDLGIAQAELARVRRLPNPTLEGSVRFDGEGDPEIDLDAMIDVVELFLALPRGAAAEAGVEAAKLEAVGSILDVSFEARRAFYEYQASLQALDLRRTVLQALEGSADAARRLREAGNVIELDAASEESLAKEARVNLQHAELMVAAQRERMNAVMGLWGDNMKWNADARLPEPPKQELAVEALEAQSVARSLDLEVHKRRYTAAARRANVEQASGWLPELKAGVSAERDEHWGVGPAVEVEIPLFYQGQGEVGAARAEMRRQQSLFADTAVRLRARAREIAVRLRAAREAVAYYRDVLLPLKERVVNEAQLQYNAMNIGVFQLIQAKRDQIETASVYVEKLREYWMLRSDAEQLLAGRLDRAAAVEIARSAAPAARPSAH